MDLASINGILKSRFEDGGMPSPVHNVSGKVSNRSQIVRCITNTWKALNKDSSVMICVDDKSSVDDTDSLIWMNRLLSLTSDYRIDDIDDIIKHVMDNYLDLMKHTQSRFFLATVQIQYRKLFKEEIHNDTRDNVTVYKRRKKLLHFKRRIS